MQQKGESVFIAPNATVIGEVALGNNSSVWYGAVLRGDVEQITIGNSSNIQDNAVIHADFGEPAIIGDYVTIGHSAIVHAATVGSYSLIGMHAVVLNRAKIGKCCIIGASALVPEGMEIPDYSLVMGIPAKIIKQLSPEIIEHQLRQSAEHYVKISQQHQKGVFNRMI